MFIDDLPDVYFALNIVLHEEDSKLAKSWDVRFDLQPELNCVCRCNVKYDRCPAIQIHVSQTRDAQFRVDRKALENVRIM